MLIDGKYIHLLLALPTKEAHFHNHNVSDCQKSLVCGGNVQYETFPVWGDCGIL